MTNSYRVKLKRLIAASVLFFLLIFLSGYALPDRHSFLIPLVLYSGTGIVLMRIARATDLSAPLKTPLTTTGIASFGFFAGFLYGWIGIRGYYEVYEPIYLGLVIVSALAYIVGILQSISALKKEPGSVAY